MAEESWFQGGPVGGQEGSFFGSAALPPPLPRRDAAYELRPLTTGEVLDRTFFLYRNNVWLFVGLSSIAAAVSLVTSIVQQVYVYFGHPVVPVVKGANPFAVAHLGAAIGIGVLAAVLYLVVYSLTQAATVSAVTSIYLGDETSMGVALRSVTGRWYRYPLIALWQAWSAMWLYAVLFVPAVVGIVFLTRRGTGGVGAIAGLGLLMAVGGLGGVVYGMIAYIRNSLAVPAEVMEGLTVRAAMRRSKTLAAGTKGRIFLLFLFLAALYVVAIAVESPLTFLILRHRGVGVALFQAMLIFVNFVVTSVVAPVGAIGLCLFYIDQRVRKEGFDIEYLMEKAGPGVAAAAVELP